MKIKVSMKEWKTLRLAQTINEDELYKRLQACGWINKWTSSGTEILSKPPQTASPSFENPANPGNTITWGHHQYNDKERTWKKIKSSFLIYFPDLKFIWENPFVIPPNFRKDSQRIETDEQRAKRISKEKEEESNKSGKELPPTTPKPPTYLEKPIALLTNLEKPIALYDPKEEGGKGKQIQEIELKKSPAVILEDGSFEIYDSLSTRIKYVITDKGTPPIISKSAPKKIRIIAVKKIKKD